LSVRSLQDLGMRLGTVVVGMDFSRAGIAAATWVTKFLTPTAKVALVHAIDSPPRPSLVPEILSSEALEIDARADCEDELNSFARLLGANVVRTGVRVGRAAEVINQFAIDVGADLIVVGPHGKQRHRSPFLGTTADTLVRGAIVPVLVGPRARISGRTRVIAAVTEGALQAKVLAWGDLAARRHA
jgi:nucleotide-binding universal stress UspA family protein